MRGFVLRVLGHFERQSLLQRLLVGIAMTLLIGVADTLTGQEAHFSLFYLLPIAFLTWLSGFRTGFAVACFSTLVWIVADRLAAPVAMNRWILSWNALSTLGVFSVLVYALSALKSAYRREHLLARRDALTQIANRQAFFELAQAELARCRRYDHPVSCALIDCDHFKRLNDTLGHPAGDQLLACMGRVLRESLRHSDVAARLGGDEFVVFLPETPSLRAHAAMQKLREALLEQMRANHWPVTFSIGIVSYAQAPESIDLMLSEADGAMYEAKLLGKDRIALRLVEPGRDS